jgi:hypothetical protein
MNIRSYFILALTSMSLLNAAQRPSKVTLVNKTDTILSFQRTAPKGEFMIQVMESLNSDSTKTFNMKDGAGFIFYPSDKSIGSKTITINKLSPEVTIEVTARKSHLSFKVSSGKAAIETSKNKKK